MKREIKKIEISTNFIWKTILILGLVCFLFLIRDVLVILFLAIVVVSAVQPFVNKLEKRRVPRVVSAIGLFAIFFLVFGFLIYLIVPTVSGELKEFGEKVPTYFKGVEIFLGNVSQVAENYHFEKDLQQFIDTTSSKIAESITGMFSNTLQVFSGFLKFIVVVSLSFYMLVKKDGTKGFLQSMIPKKNLAYAEDLVERIQSKIGRWLIGQLTLILIIIILDYLVLTALGVPFALVIALIGGLLEIIPYIGPIIAIIPAVLAALTISPLTALFVVIAYVIIQQIENHILTPLIMKTAVGLNPVIIILVLLIGGTIAGIPGVILAVPFATAADLVIGDLINKKNLI